LRNCRCPLQKGEEEEEIKPIFDAKKFPIFVSDATKENVMEMIQFLKLEHLVGDRLLVEDHPYWNSE
jgi:hypothetical protein